MDPIVCEECNNKIFKNIPNFRKHVRHFHPKKVAELFPKKSFNFSCETCRKNFSHKRHLLFHKRKVHNEEPCKQLMFICPLCEKNILWDEFTSHVEVLHNIRLVEENLCFPSLGEFTDWKDIIEAEDLNHYIKVRGDRQTGAGVLQRYFHCHRSGHYQTRGDRLRRLKSQGSKKINAYCPANMKLMINPDGSCTVSYLKTHLGHRNDLRHLTLTRSDKKLLPNASFATDGIFCAIFEEEDVPDSTSEEKAEKLHLVTQKDLLNIKAAFDLHSTSCSENETVTIDQWVSEIKNSASVLYHKPPDRVSKEYLELEKEDYLIIMNEAQKEMLKKFGQECICVDQTHKINSNSFQLITLLVVDSMRQGFPCAFLICNRSDQAALTTFFSFVKEQAGPLLPKFFMANIDDYLFNAWVCVMGFPEKRLFCSWHVDHAWSANLNSIVDPDKQVETYNMLKTLLLLERDENTCNINIYESFNGMLDDADTREFAAYFKNNFSQNLEYWAYCHRLNLGLNVNTHLERLHRIFEYIYFDGRNVRRLDKCLFVLMRFIKDQLFDTLVVKQKHSIKIASAVQNLKERHFSSLSLQMENIIEGEDTWQVLTDTEKMSVVKIGDTGCKCSLKCKDCNTCLHKYVCSCIDNSITWNMCKHIHLVCRFLQEKSVLMKEKVQEGSSVEDNYSLDFDISGDSEEIKIISPGIHKKEVINGSVAEKKEALLNEFRDMVNGVTSPHEIDIIRKCVLRVKHELKAFPAKHRISLNNLSTVDEKIIQQMRIDSTRQQ